jgi:16S rRNA (guanine966-N2)-methyltransferase
MTRIVAGTAKGRRLAVPAAGTRPTSDRVREALFSTLAASFRLDGAWVLDLYAGTGAVGLEALSRGAAGAVFVESHRAALTVLRRNVDAVGLPGARIVAQAVSSFLATTPDQPFDFVFLDPPYALDGAKIYGTLAELSKPEWLAPDAFVVVERSRHNEPSGWASDFLTPVGVRRYGDTTLWYGRRQ